MHEDWYDDWYDEIEDAEDKIAASFVIALAIAFAGSLIATSRGPEAFPETIVTEPSCRLVSLRIDCRVDAGIPAINARGIFGSDNPMFHRGLFWLALNRSDSGGKDEQASENVDASHW